MVCEEFDHSIPFSGDVPVGEFLLTESADLIDDVDFLIDISDGDIGLFSSNESSNIVGFSDCDLTGIEDELMEDNSLTVTDHLLMGAEAVQVGDFHLSSLVSMRLIDILSDHENGESPFDRLALHFAQALGKKSLNNGDVANSPQIGRSNALSAFHFLQELSPNVKFAHFTANQAILEATLGQQEIHVIDFDIMEGIQWPPLMVDLATRGVASLRITALLFEKKCSSTRSIQQTGYRLQEFAESIKLRFVFDEMAATKEEDFEKIQVGHTLIANCMINQLHMPRRENSLVKMFLNGLRKLSPKIIVLVQEELFNFNRVASMSFVEFFCEAIEHYSALSESLFNGFCVGHKLASRIIEKEFIKSKVLESIQSFPCGIHERRLWGDEFPSMHGYRPIPLSSCNVTQAKHLVSLFNGGYRVQNDKCKLSLFWKSRTLTTASIWVPTSSYCQLMSTSILI